MNFKFGSNDRGEVNLTIEQLIDMFKNAVRLNLTKEESIDLANVLQRLYDDNKMIYGEEDEFVRN